MRRLLVGLAVLFTCTTAQAEVVAMLEVKRDPNTSERDEWAVTHAVTDFFAERNMPVVLPVQAQERLGSDYMRCDALPCASGYLERLQADLAVAAVVFAEGQRVQAVNIALIRPDGLAFTGSVEVGQQGVNVAARDAIATAWERYQRGPGPWLEVRGVTGHRLRLDGELRGALPYRDRVEPGVHQIRVESPAGKAHYEASFSVPDDPAQYTVVDATDANVVTATILAQTEAPPGARRTSSYNYVAGGALVAAGGLLLTSGSLAIARDGRCVGGGAPPCDAYAAGGASTGLVAAGAVLATAGIVWLAWRPLKTRTAMEVSVRGTTLNLRGAF